MSLNLYSYSGPVMDFNVCVKPSWRSQTKATSEVKARNNLMHQYKKDNNKSPGAKITLPGKLVIVQ